MNILIGIPTCNRNDHLKELFASLKKLEVPTDVDLITVVILNNRPDNKDTQGVCSEFAKEMSKFNVCYLEESKRGISYSRNRIVDEFYNSKCELLFCIDDDDLPQENWISNTIKECLSSNSVLIHPQIAEPFYEDGVSASIIKSKVFRVAKNHRGASGIVLSRKIFTLLQRPFFDEKLALSGLEDGDFINRCNDHNVQYSFVDTKIYYRVSRERGQIINVIKYSFSRGLAMSHYDLKYIKNNRLYYKVINFVKYFGKTIIILLLIPFVCFLYMPLCIRIIHKVARNLGRTIASFGVTSKLYNAS